MFSPGSGVRSYFHSYSNYLAGMYRKEEKQKLLASMDGMGWDLFQLLPVQWSRLLFWAECAPVASNTPDPSQSQSVCLSGNRMLADAIGYGKKSSPWVFLCLGKTRGLSAMSKQAESAERWLSVSAGATRRQEHQGRTHGPAHLFILSSQPSKHWWWGVGRILLLEAYHSLELLV